MKNAKRVAILLSTYNSIKYLKEQIDSIISQTYKDWSLYIRDDGSNDDTITLVKMYQDNFSNIIFLDDGLSLGPKDSFMKLLQSVESEYYMFCDHDDIWCPEKIELSVYKADAQIRKNPSVPFVVATDLKVVDENLNELYASFWDFQKVKESDFNDYILHWFSNNVNGCAMLINHVCKQISFPMPSSAYMHDSWIMLSTLAHKGCVLPIHKQLVLYRQHGGNVLGAKKNNISHYLNDFKGVVNRTVQQYKTVNYLQNVTWLKFIFLKVKYRIGV